MNQHFLIGKYSGNGYLASSKRLEN